MRSHLARNAYRRLLSTNGGLLASSPSPAVCRCCCARHYPLSGIPAVAGPAAAATTNSVVVRHQPRRTFLAGVFSKPPREVKQQEIDPGYEVLLQFRASQAENARPPPREQLVRAFQDFFGYKYQARKTVNATQALLTARLLRHLRESSDDRLADGLSLEDLRTAQNALARVPGSGGGGSMEDYLALCREVYQEIVNRRGSSPLDFRRHIVALCQCGAALEAVELLAGYWRDDATSRRDEELWIHALRGLAREGREEELLRQVKAAEAAGLEYTPAFHEVMTTFYIGRNNLMKAQQWFRRPIHGGMHPTPATYAEILKFSQSNAYGGVDAQAKWAKAVFQELCDVNPPKELWDIIFQWAVVSLGKGVDDIKHMMDTMVRHNEGRQGVKPDIATINGLVRAAAVEKKDALLAERFIQLGLDMGLSPDSETYILQLDYRIDANDLSGAFSAFRDLQNVGCTDEEDALVVNKYIRALCAVRGADTTRVLDVLASVEERQVMLEPATVVALCMVFLRNDQQFEAIDTLSIHAMQYSVEERAVVRDALVAYCLDRKNSTSRAWDAYSLLRQYFAETPAESRVRLMEGFFRRRRADMACYVFGHMRSAADEAVRPTADVYVRCLEGLGRCPDATGLRMVHNMLKMDTRIQLDTRMSTALMIAYAACDDRARALDFWKDITTSAEGPSYNSLAAVFWVCEGLPFGDATARAVWAKLHHMEVDIPSFVYDAYVGAIAGQGNVDEAKKLIAGMEASAGYAPTGMTLGIAYNAFPGDDFKDDFESWAAGTYPELWEQLKKKGYRTTVDGLKMLKIVREMKA